jgi:hypothetical protein
VLPRAGFRAAFLAGFVDLMDVFLVIVFTPRFVHPSKRYRDAAPRP